jgi:cell division septation protein DedD
MRDLERWKDKVEVSLDGRQIFGLFFGSAVLACLIFVGGVATGKRIGERAAAQAAPSAEDPLAALDRLGGETADDGLTFHEALAPADHHLARRAHVEPPRPELHPPKPAPAPPAAHPAAPKPLAAAGPKPAAAVPPAKPEGDGRYTLQLSAFAERGDAEQFLGKLQGAGYKPFITQSEIPGRGVFYRVRVGDYTSRRAAAEAKGELERRQHLMAYVAKL